MQKALVFFYIWKGSVLQKYIHPGRLTWNIQITHLERKMIFQTFMIMFHVNLQGCIYIYITAGDTDYHIPIFRIWMESLDSPKVCAALLVVLFCRHFLDTVWWPGSWKHRNKTTALDVSRNWPSMSIFFHLLPNLDDWYSRQHFLKH